MKQLFAFALLACAFGAPVAAFAEVDVLRPPPRPPSYPAPPPPPPHYEPPTRSCSIVYPGRSDRNNRRCVNHAAFGVAYQGFFFSDAPCFPSAYEAESAMRRERACELPADWGYCQLVYPGQADRNNRRCVNPGAWSVAYQGYHFSDAPCFPGVGQAMHAMRNTWSCRGPAYQGRCQLVYPGQPDRGGRRCVNPGAWGMAYDGYFLSGSPCRSSMDEAMRAIQADPACR